MYLLISIILSYLIGSIPTAYLIMKASQHSDIRQMGSGNVGAMNVFDLIGWKAALLVFLIDALKGVAAVYICILFSVNPYVGLIAAVFAHIYPLWLKFHGGKGLSTGLGGVLALLQWKAVLVFALVWGIFYLLIWKKRMDISNFAAALGVAVYGFIAGPNYGLIILLLLIGFKHLKEIISSKEKNLS